MDKLVAFDEKSFIKDIDNISVRVYTENNVFNR